MALAVLFVLAVLGAGAGVLRLLGVPKGANALGLAPAVGLAVLAVVASWCVLLGAPPPVAGVAVVVLALLGFALFDYRTFLETVRTQASVHRVSTALLVTAVAVPLIAMGFAFAGTEVPLSPHDGAAHTETIQAYRLGRSWSDWYPPGTGALFAAWLQLFPWVDSAQGAFDLGLSLPALATLAVFGLGVAVWRDMQIAAAAALMLSFTYLYPYFPQLWSGWPLAISVILAVGIWAIALEYLRQPSARWGIVAGLLLGAIVLVHGTELYSLLIVLPIVMVASRRQVIWRSLPRVIGLAIVVALASAAVYLPALAHWAGAGGAYVVGLQEATVLAGSGSQAAASQATVAGPGLFATFALDSLGIDLPLRLFLLAGGLLWSLRERVGRTVVAVGIAFAGIAVALNEVTEVPLLRQIYALTYPWGMHYRLLMLVTIAQVLLAGAGGVILVRQLNHWAERPTAWGRRLGRVTRILVVAWVLLTTWALAVFTAQPAAMVLGYSADDAAAMAWLREHAAPGEVLVNDGYADAGIWAPYKAGVSVLVPRSAPLYSDDVIARALVRDNVAHLDQSPAAAAAACAEHVKYIYRGARVSAWDTRTFPPLEELRASPALEEVFNQGEAIVFRVGLNCD